MIYSRQDWKILHKYLTQSRVLALLTAAMGVVNVFSAMTPAMTERSIILEIFSPLEVTQGGRLTAVLAGFALLVLSQGLARRQRTAWGLTLAALAVSLISHLLKGLDYEEASLTLLLIGYLLWQRHPFQARSDPPTIWRGIRLVLAALGFTLFYGATGFFLLDHHYSVTFGLGTALRQTVIMFTQFYDPGLQPITGFGRYFANSIYLVGALTLSYGLWALLRPVILRGPATPAERERARQIVEAHGRSSLARFVLFPDKAYYFSSGGSVIGYAVRRGMALALGDPIGPSADAAAVIDGFRQHCLQHGWQCAFYQTQPGFLAYYKAAGFVTLPIGQEALVDLATFTLEGKENKQFRTAINRMNRVGQRAGVMMPPLSDELVAELRTISDEWLQTMKSQEMRFSLGWFDEEYVRQSSVMVVQTVEGRVTAFLNLLPRYQKNELTLDLMRRRAEVEPGTMDFLFASLLQWGKEQGYATCNLGLSALAGVGEGENDPAVEKALHYVYERSNQFYNFQGLHAFKEKFHPTWELRYLVFPSYAILPNVVTTLAQVSSGDDVLWVYVRQMRPLLHSTVNRIRQTLQRSHSG